MKTISAILIILALVIGIVPQFTDCLAQGKAITLASGKSLPMKCHWSRQAEVAVSIPLLVVGGLTFFGRRKETLRALAVVGIALGAAAMLIPTYLIGVCAGPEMICNMLMKPVLLFAGVLIIATCVVALVYLRGEDPDAADAGPEDQTQ
jgi:hypothetical protein